MLLWVSWGWLHGGSPVCSLGTSTWSPPKSLAWQKGFRVGSGLTLKLLGLWLLVCNCSHLQAGLEVPRVVIVGVLRLVVPLLLLRFFLVVFSLTGGLLLILLLGLSLTAVGGLVGLRSRCCALTFGPPLGCLLLIRVGGPSRLRFRGFGRFMMSVVSSCLIRMLCSWMSPLMQAMFLVHSLSGLGLLRLHLLMLISSVVDLSPLGAWFLGEGALCSGSFGLVCTR